MNSTSTIDKYIKLSWQIVQNDVVLACGLTVIMMVMAAGVGIIGSLILFPVGFLLLFNAARKLFYTSLYGQGATMYQTLPVKPEEIVLGKVFAITAADMLYMGVMIACLFAAALLSGDLTQGGAFDLPQFIASLADLEYLSGFDVPYVIAVGIAGYVVSEFRLWMLVLFGIVWYNSLPQSAKGGLTKLAAVAIVAGVQIGLGYIVRMITEISGEPYWLPAESAGILLDVIAAVVLYKLTVKRMKCSDNAGWEVA